MEFYPVFCIESGDLFSFCGGKDKRNAAQEFVFRIMRIRGATLGETVIVREDYRGKKLATFNTEDLLSRFSDRSYLKFQKLGDRIHFTKVPVSRSSCFFSFWIIYHS